MFFTSMEDVLWATDMFHGRYAWGGFDDWVHLLISPLTLVTFCEDGVTMTTCSAKSLSPNVESYFICNECCTHYDTYLPGVDHHDILQDKKRDATLAEELAGSRLEIPQAIAENKILAGTDLDMSQQSGISYFIDVAVPLRSHNEVVKEFGFTPQYMKMRPLESFDVTGRPELVYPKWSEAKAEQLIIRKKLGSSMVKSSKKVRKHLFDKQATMLRRHAIKHGRSRVNGNSLIDITTDEVLQQRKEALNAKQQQRKIFVTIMKSESLYFRIRQ